MDSHFIFTGMNSLDTSVSLMRWVVWMSHFSGVKTRVKKCSDVFRTVPGGKERSFLSSCLCHLKEQECGGCVGTWGSLMLTMTDLSLQKEGKQTLRYTTESKNSIYYVGVKDRKDFLKHRRRNAFQRRAVTGTKPLKGCDANNELSQKPSGSDGRSLLQE